MARSCAPGATEFSVAATTEEFEALGIGARVEMDGGADDSEGADIRDDEDAIGAGASGCELAT